MTMGKNSRHRVTTDFDSFQSIDVNRTHLGAEIEHELTWEQLDS